MFEVLSALNLASQMLVGEAEITRDMSSKLVSSYDVGLVDIWDSGVRPMAHPIKT